MHSHACIDFSSMYIWSLHKKSPKKKKTFYPQNTSQISRLFYEISEVMFYVILCTMYHQNPKLHPFTNIRILILKMYNFTK